MNKIVLHRPIYETYWILPGRFRAGEFPGASSDEEAREKLRWLLNGGTNLLIDLTELGESGLRPYEHLLYEEASKFQVTVLHRRIPLLDFSKPLKGKMIEILDTIDLALSLGKNIYLHCHGGKGRTGTVVGCYLVRQGLTGEEALEQIERLRTQIPSHAEQSPETAGQIRMVLEWKQGQ
ncbi:MAG TPA: dual specificity protein phosphatase family protein [Anaerolineales bacterium]|nr:dual specificity protein phosphatase family protein [Anaerolineales bacterium]